MKFTYGLFFISFAEVKEGVKKDIKSKNIFEGMHTGIKNKSIKKLFDQLYSR